MGESFHPDFFVPLCDVIIKLRPPTILLLFVSFFGPLRTILLWPDNFLSSPPSKKYLKQRTKKSLCPKKYFRQYLCVRIPRISSPAIYAFLLLSPLLQPTLLTHWDRPTHFWYNCLTWEELEPKQAHKGQITPWQSQEHVGWETWLDISWALVNSSHQGVRLSVWTDVWIMYVCLLWEYTWSLDNSKSKWVGETDCSTPK